MPFVVYYRPLMTSSRLILIFLGFIFVIIVILTSNKISSAIRQRFGKYLPSTQVITEGVTPTPTIVEVTASPTPFDYSGNSSTNSSTPTGEIPATGPNDLMWLILVTSLIAGLSFKKFGSKSIEQ